MRGLDYVAIDPGIAKDVKIALMAKALRRDRHWVAGHFPEFFGEVATHQPDGDLSRIPDDLLDQWAGGVKRWGQLVREHLCDEKGVLMAWWRYNGRALARLAKDRARKGGGTSVENPRNDDAGSVDITDTGTIPSFPDGKEDPPPSPAREAFLAEVPELYRPAVLNAFRAANNPDALLMELQAIVSGMHPPAYDHATIGRAIHDLAVSGAKVTPKSLRGFCRGLVDKGPPAKGRERATAPTGTVPRLRVVGDDDV